jgi:3-hydroxyisobutyrate dehydrogenase
MLLSRRCSLPAGASPTAEPDRYLWLQMSTIGIAATEGCAKLAERHGLRFVDAPVLGTKRPA